MELITGRIVHENKRARWAGLRGAGAGDTRPTLHLIKPTCLQMHIRCNSHFCWYYALANVFFCYWHWRTCKKPILAPIASILTKWHRHDVRRTTRIEHLKQVPESSRANLPQAKFNRTKSGSLTDDTIRAHILWFVLRECVLNKVCAHGKFAIHRSARFEARECVETAHTIGVDARSVVFCG